MSRSYERTGLGELATTLLDVVPLVSRSIRDEMRANRDAALSVPQFRVLGYVHRRRSVSLSAIAEHLGLTLPSMSRMVDGLLARGLVARHRSRSDRRCVEISTTARGESAWLSARTATRDSMMARLGVLGAERRLELRRGLAALRLVFSEAENEPAHAGGENDRP